MVTTPDLGLPLLATQQQQPNVTHNEVILQLSAMLNGVIDMTTSAPPGSPTEGDAYVVAPTGTGAWAGRDDSVAVYTSGGWRFIPGNDSSGTPITMGARQHGMVVYNRADDLQYGWTGAAWASL